MKDLNPRQLEAVRYVGGPLLVLAGAGSGKTRVIARKIAHLVGECGLAPRHIAAVTFTNKAAREMKARIAKQHGFVVRDHALMLYVDCQKPDCPHRKAR